MNILIDVIPAAQRKYVYAVLALAALVLAAYKASQGDWLEFAGILLGSLGFGTATANTHPESWAETEPYQEP